MDIVADYLTYLPIRFARNPIDVTVDAASESVIDRTNLNYLLEIWKPAAFQAGTFELYQTLAGSEIPPRTENGLLILEGCRFEISTYIDALLAVSPPVFGQKDITVCPEVTMPFFLKSSIDPVAGSGVTNQAEIAIKAKINEDQFPGWKDLFFVSWIGAGRRFLTWQPDRKIVDRDQPEFLYFLLNMQPKPASLTVRVQLLYTNGTTERRSLTTTGNTLQNCVYCIPVGFKALGLDAIETETGKEIDSYEIWLNNEQDDRVSEIRTYVVNQQFDRNIRYLIFQNSLGGFDTLKCWGQSSVSLNVTANLAQKTLEYGYLPSSEELFVISKTGERTMTVNTGRLTAAEIEYLEELVWSEKALLVTADGFIPVISDSQTFQGKTDDEYYASRAFTFKLAKEAMAYSRLPLAQPSSSRPTVWVPEQPYCQIDSSTGLRNGYQGAAKLRLYYADTMQPVKSVGTKQNIPGTEGYYPPQLSPSCNALTTPFQNAELKRSGTFTRNNCVSSYGTVADVIVAAGRFGSEISQNDANARAEAEWARLNTQDWANQYGACLAGPEFYQVAPPPSGRFNCRFGYISGVACGISGGLAIISGKPEDVIYSNAWYASNNTNPASLVYPPGSNDIKLPCNPGTHYRLNMTKTVSSSVRIQVYLNGAEFFNQVFSGDNNNIIINPQVGATAPTIADLAQMYVKFTLV